MGKSLREQPLPPGRPIKATDVIIAKILGGLRHGLRLEVACAAAGVDRASFYRWRQKYRENPEKYYYLEPICDNAVEAARLQGEAFWQQHLSNLAIKGKPSDRVKFSATMEILKRCYRNHWGDHVRVDVEATVEVAVPPAELDVQVWGAPAEVVVDGEADDVLMLPEPE